MDRKAIRAAFPASRPAAAGMCLMISACVSASGQHAAPVNETVLNAESGFVIPVELNGRRLRLEVDPAAPASIMLNEKTAKDLGLIGTRSATFVVGPMRYKGRARTSPVTISGKTSRKEVMWFKREMVVGADGAINPAELPWDSVRMQLRAPRGDEEEIVLPVVYDRERGLHTYRTLGMNPIVTRFTLRDGLTTATAATGAVAAKRFGGAWKGNVFSHPVRYGIVRPVRNMTLEKPFSIRKLELTDLTVRVRDDGGDHRLPSEARVEDPEEEESIVVTSEKRRYSGPAFFWLMIGRNDLTQCSSVRYDRKRRLLILSCSAHTA